MNGSFDKNYNKCQIIIQSTLLYRKHIPAFLLVTWNVTSQLSTYCIAILPTPDETYTLQNLYHHIKKKLQCKTYIVAALDLFPLLLTILLQSNFISGLLFNVRSSSPQYFDIYKLSFQNLPYTDSPVKPIYALYF